ncbi:B-cell receptor-associated protein 29 [Sesbania bispinosa]|nr:B-cell receptor-associated protein 29 [Sesbania bispinosa]
MGVRGDARRRLRAHSRDLSGGSSAAEVDDGPYLAAGERVRAATGRAVLQVKARWLTRCGVSCGCEAARRETEQHDEDDAKWWFRCWDSDSHGCLGRTQPRPETNRDGVRDGDDGTMPRWWPQVMAACGEPNGGQLAQHDATEVGGPLSFPLSSSPFLFAGSNLLCFYFS